MSEVKILSPRLPSIHKPSLPLPFNYVAAVQVATPGSESDVFQSTQPLVFDGVTITAGQTVLIYNLDRPDCGIYLVSDVPDPPGPTLHSADLQVSPSRAATTVLHGTHIGETWAQLSLGLWVPILNFIANERLYLPENRSERRVT